MAELEQTGVPWMEEITGGFPANALVQVIGPPGTGKTVLAMQAAFHIARQERDVIFLTIYSEPVEKIVRNMAGFSFFDRSLVGSRIQLLSLKGAIAEGPKETLSLITGATQGKRKPLIILDGYNGLRSALGVEESKSLVAALSSQLLYLDALCVICFEADIDDYTQYPELASADMVIGLRSMRFGTKMLRNFQVIKMRGVQYKEGLHSLRITANGLEIFPRLATVLPEIAQPQPGEYRHRFDLPEFDEMLDGGVPNLSTTGIFGGPGTGKTTLGLHYLLAGSTANEHGLLVTFRESEYALLRKTRELGLDLKAPLDAGRIAIISQPPVEINPDEIGWRVEQIIQARGTKRVVIDGVAELEQVARVLGPESEYLTALTEFLRRSGVTTLLLRDAQHIADNGASVDTSHVQAVDNRVVLRRVEYRSNFYRILSVINMQASAHDTRIREFRIDKGGIRILREEESSPGVLKGIAETSPVTEHLTRERG